ncbi:hypothetical protein JOB18_037151 [Solea senegalensis]|uniref:Uncharacterized protein n=1 Tax=Solea senegalensis TaxID=28829 RepID=A0AAV6Q3V8_SOLSE|nr:hypothetical protein JOB18_037151 [Solea senegalensis]
MFRELKKEKDWHLRFNRASKASVLQPAEDAAGCHGSSAGNSGGGAELQLQMSSSQRQHPRAELWQHRVYLHHYVCRTVLPRGPKLHP